MRKFVAFVVVLSFLLVPSAAFADEPKPINLKAIKFDQQQSSGMTMEQSQWLERHERATKNRNSGKLLMYIGGGLAVLGVAAGSAGGGGGTMAVASALPGVGIGGFGFLMKRGAESRLRELEANKPKSPSASLGFTVSW